MKKLRCAVACVVAPAGHKPIGGFDVRHGADEDIDLRFRDKDGAVTIWFSMPPEEWKLICDTIAEVDKHKAHELFQCYACDKLPGSEPP